MTKNMGEYAKEWQGNAEADALYVILTDSKYFGKKWDPEVFFATGEEEISRVFAFMEQKSIQVPSGTYLDFGCGVGRISRALKKRFEQGFGVDISEKMVELARSYVSDVEFITNQVDSLEQFKDGSIDFVYSHIVLQHIPNQYQKSYIDEFLRILRPGGLAAFQIPLAIIHPRVIKPSLLIRAKKIIKKLMPFLITIKRWIKPAAMTDYEFRYEMNPLPDDVIRDLCKRHVCIIEAAPATNSCEPDHNGRVEFYDLIEHRAALEQSKMPNRYLSCMYFVRKP